MSNSSNSARPPANGGRLSVLGNRNFTLLWLGQIVSNAGSWMQIVAQGILVYDLTHSPFYLGVVGMARAIPMIVFPPMGGVIADRLPRLKWLKVTQTISALLALVLALLISADVVKIWHIMLISVLSGLVNAFDQPTRQAMLPDLVRREDLTKAVALNSSAWQGASLFGPTLAGLTVATLGVAAAFYFNAVSFFAVVAALFLMRGVPERSAAAGPRRGLTFDLAEGVRYVRATPLIFALLAMSAVTSIFGRSYTQLLPAFASEAFHSGGFGLGLLYAAPGAGTLVGAVAIAVVSDTRRKGVVFLVAMFMFAATLVLFTLNRQFLLGIGLLFITGLFSLVFSAMMTTILQLEAPPAMRGRVMSLVTVTMQGLAPFGALLTGAMATRMGTPEAVALSALVCGVVALLGYVFAPSVRDFAYTGEAATHGPPTTASAPGPAAEPALRAR